MRIPGFSAEATLYETNKKPSTFGDIVYPSKSKPVIAQLPVGGGSGRFCEYLQCCNMKDKANMDRYGYISMPPSQALNPDGLPIGFVKDVASSGEEHVGMTCAACHTGWLSIGGTKVIVEGGPTLADFRLFLKETTEGLAAAINNPAKQSRFFKKVLNSDNPPQSQIDQLRQRMTAKLNDLQTRLDQNIPSSSFGNGRVDAFGHIMTRVLAQDLGVPANAKPPYGPVFSAPVSYPFLWDTHHHKVVQWNGSAPNGGLGPLSRNVGEVLGVFGELEVIPRFQIPFFPRPAQYKSSANLRNLNRLEQLVAAL